MSTMQAEIDMQFGRDSDSKIRIQYKLLNCQIVL